MLHPEGVLYILSPKHNPILSICIKVFYYRFTGLWKKWHLRPTNLSDLWHIFIARLIHPGMSTSPYRCHNPAPAGTRWAGGSRSHVTQPCLHSTTPSRSGVHHWSFVCDALKLGLAAVASLTTPSRYLHYHAIHMIKVSILKMGFRLFNLNFLFDNRSFWNSLFYQI